MQVFEGCEQLIVVRFIEAYACILDAVPDPATGGLREYRNDPPYLAYAELERVVQQAPSHTLRNSVGSPLQYGNSARSNWTSSIPQMCTFSSFEIALAKASRSWFSFSSAFLYLDASVMPVTMTSTSSTGPDPARKSAVLLPATRV